MTKEGELGKRQDGRLRPEKSRKKGRFQGLPSAALRLPLSLSSPSAQLFLPLHSNARPLSPFLSLAALATLSSNSVLGKIKVKPKTTPGGKRRQLLPPPLLCRHRCRWEGRHTASAGESFDFQSDRCILSASAHTPQTARPHLSQRRRGDGRNRRRIHLCLPERMAGAGVSVPAPRHLPIEKSPATAGLQLYCPQCSSTYRFHPPDASSGKNGWIQDALHLGCVCISVSIHIHPLMYTDGQPPPEMGLPPPASCKSACEDSRCLPHVVLHLSWAVFLPPKPRPIW